MQTLAMCDTAERLDYVARRIRGRCLLVRLNGGTFRVLERVCRPDFYVESVVCAESADPKDIENWLNNAKGNVQ